MASVSSRGVALSRKRDATSSGNSALYSQGSCKYSVYKLPVALTNTTNEAARNEWGSEKPLRIYSLHMYVMCFYSGIHIRDKRKNA